MEKICQICGKHYQVSPSRKGYTCSRKCNAKRLKQLRGRLCKGCGKNYVINNRWYCETCRAKRKQNYLKIGRICKNCGKLFFITIADLKRDRGKYCSRACYLTAIKAANNPNWKGGRKSLGRQLRDHPKMKTWIKDILERDNYMCFSCGQIGGKLEVHHIIPLEKMIDVYKYENGSADLKGLLEWDEFWNKDNGVTLCKDCHNKIPKFSKKDEIYIPKKLLDFRFQNGIAFMADCLEDVRKELMI